MAPAATSAAELAAIANAPPAGVSLRAALLLIGGLAIGMSPMVTIAAGFGGRRMAGTSPGLPVAHEHLYSGWPAVAFSVLQGMAGSPWLIVFLAMAGTRVLSAGMIAHLKVWITTAMENACTGILHQTPCERRWKHGLCYSAEGGVAQARFSYPGEGGPARYLRGNDGLPKPPGRCTSRGCQIS